jgi:hypothetical protein
MYRLTNTFGGANAMYTYVPMPHTRRLGTDENKDRIQTWHAKDGNERVYGGFSY